MQLIVCQQTVVGKQVKKLQEKNLNAIIVSICDPGKFLFITPRMTNCPIHRMVMEDVLSGTEKNCPTKKHLVDCINWFDELLPKYKETNDALIVHCYAGISRSPAVALMLMTYAYGLDKAVTMLAAARPTCCPNSLITRYADDLLGMRGRLVIEAEKFVTARLFNRYDI